MLVRSSPASDSVFVRRSARSGDVFANPDSAAAPVRVGRLDPRRVVVLHRSCRLRLSGGRCLCGRSPRPRPLADGRRGRPGRRNPRRPLLAQARDDRLRPLARGVRSALMAVARARRTRRPSPIYALAVVGTVAATPFAPAQGALLPDLARSPQQLTAANASSSTIDSAGMFVGPALGGLLLAATSVAVVFATDGGALRLVGPERRTDRAPRPSGQREPATRTRSRRRPAARGPRRLQGDRGAARAAPARPAARRGDVRGRRVRRADRRARARDPRHRRVRCGASQLGRRGSAASQRRSWSARSSRAAGWRRTSASESRCGGCRILLIGVWPEQALAFVAHGGDRRGRHDRQRDERHASAAHGAARGARARLRRPRQRPARRGRARAP